jgi:hypothetical protein
MANHSEQPAFSWAKRSLRAACLALWRALRRFDWLGAAKLLLLLCRYLLQAAWFMSELLFQTIRSRPLRSADSLVGALWAGAFLVIITPPLPSDEELGSDLECLALNIYHEARGEPEEGQVAVAQVVMNRVAHNRFPDHVCAVIKQGGEIPKNFCQFSWWCDGRTDKPETGPAWQDSRRVAKEILSGRHGDPTDGALWYHAKHVAPLWRSDFEEGPTIGEHIFYRPKSSD